MGQSPEFPQYAFRPPASYSRGRKAGQPSVIVIHTTEGHEEASSAEDGAANDARRTDGTSTHFFCDQNSTVQCVLTSDEAHAARAHGNDVGIQIEICGRAGQSSAQWADLASNGAIEQCAQLCVALRRRYEAARLPLVKLTSAQLRAGAHGFVGHVDVTYAWPEDHGTHTDPGPHFPWSKLFARIQQLERPVTTAVTTAKGTHVTVLGELPVLRVGDSDQPGDTRWILRAQAVLKVLADPSLVPDGAYGPKTAAAIDKLMVSDGARSTSDGSRIGLPEWRRLYGIWS